jgi:hypothetical protein
MVVPDSRRLQPHAALVEIAVRDKYQSAKNTIWGKIEMDLAGDSLACEFPGRLYSE